MNIKKQLTIAVLCLFTILSLGTLTSMTMNETETNTYLEITLKIKPENRENAAAIYIKYKRPFLTQIEGATSKELLIRTEDVQVLHGFKSESEAKAYLATTLFENDVVRELKPFLESQPEVRIYSVFKN